MGLLLGLGLLSSCKDDSIDLNDGGHSGSKIDNEYYLSFSVGLQSLGAGSRAGESEVEKYEDYIDESKLYIMFFYTDETGQRDNDKDVNDVNDEGKYPDRLFKMFEPGDPAISMIPVAYNTTDNYDKSWYVRISIPQVEDGDDFVRILKENDFRVAVMANAESSKRIVMEEGSINKTDPDNWELEGGSDINELHRQTEGDKYFQSGDRINIYGFLIDLPEDVSGNARELGYHSNWVKSKSELFDSSTAADFIRKTFDPSNPDPYHGYTNLWSLWNFGGGAGDNAIDYPNAGTDFYYSDAWKEANGDFIYGKIAAALENNENGNKIDSFVTAEFSTDGLNTVVSGEKVYLQYIDFSQDGVYASAVKTRFDYSSHYYGIKLPKTLNSAGYDGSNYIKFNPVDGGCFAFTANGSGILSIRGRSATEGEKATVIAQLAKKDTYQSFEFGDMVDRVVSQKININGDSQIIYIYTDSNSEADAAEIYEIEYIQDSYLYETDREGVAPTKTQPIPMYGVASYNAIGDLWAPGTSFDLDDYNGITQDVADSGPTNTYFHPIPMLRSVAKVIVRIPKSMESHHVFLRSVNRQARWEPADVKTDTEKIWADETDEFIKTHPSLCEFYNIKGQEPFYEPSEKTSGQQSDSYINKLAWYYGTWMDQGIIKDINTKISTPSVSHPHNTAFKYPRIMNALIERSDFVQFLKAGTEEIYDKYVLYVGEKYVDDPNGISSNIENQIPKVCHVEFRIGNDSYVNLDDNNCYRIYFTKDGFNKEMPVPDLRDDDHSWERMYEQNRNNLKEHWPIIRNHVYQFTVEDINQQIVIVNLEVLPWKKVDDIQVSW